jgi:hypothetical protein
MRSIYFFRVALGLTICPALSSDLTGMCPPKETPPERVVLLLVDRTRTHSNTKWTQVNCGAAAGKGGRLFAAILEIH